MEEQTKPDKNKREMTLKDHFLMNDIEKYKYHGEFPYILTLTILLLIAITSLILLYQRQSNFVRQHIWSVNSFFIPDVTYFFTKSRNMNKFKKIYLMNNIDDLVSTINSTVQSIGEFVNESFNEIIYNSQNEVTMEVLYRDGFKSSLPIFYKINSTDLGPFSKTNDEIRDFIAIVDQVRIPFLYKLNHIDTESVDYAFCIDWTNYFNFDLTSMAGAELSIDYDFKTCPDNKLLTVQAQFMTGGYLNVVILILSLSKLVLTFKRMYFSLYTLNKIKDRLASGQHEDEEMDHFGPNACIIC